MNPDSSASSAFPDRAFRRRTLILFIVSFLLHVAMVLAIHHYRNPTLWENGGIAQYMYEGKGFRADFFGLTAAPTSLQEPGYVVSLWAVWKLFGQTPLAYLVLSVVQCAALASMVWPMGKLSPRWFPEVPVWIVQALVVMAPLYLWYGTRIHQTAFRMALHPWLLWAWLEWCRRGPWQGVWTGVLSAVAGLFQPMLLGIYGIFGAALLARSASKKDGKAALNLMAGAISMLLCLTPWTIRNYKVHGRIILLKSGMPKELWMGNNPNATGTGYVDGGAGEITNVYPPKAYARAGKVPEIVLMDDLKAEAWDYIKANPGRTVNLTLHKILWYWTVAPKNLVRSTQGGESLTFRYVYIVYWAIFAGLALLGILTARQPGKEYLAVLAVFIVFYSCIYGMTHVGQARYRGEIEFIFVFGTAAGIDFLLRRLQGKGRLGEKAKG